MLIETNYIPFRGCYGSNATLSTHLSSKIRKPEVDTSIFSKMMSNATKQLTTIVCHYLEKVVPLSKKLSCVHFKKEQIPKVTICCVLLRFCIWIPTLKLWRYCGGMGNNQFYSAYGILCATVLIIWLLFNFYPLQDDFYVVINWILCYFPRFMDTWMTRRGKQQLAVFTSIQDILLLLQFCVLLTLPISTTLFFIFSPDHPLHSRQLLPEEYGLNENIICTIVFIATTTWKAIISSVKRATWPGPLRAPGLVFGTTVYHRWYATELFDVCNCGLKFGDRIPIALGMRELKINAATHLSYRALRSHRNLLREYVTFQLLHNLLMEVSGLALVIIHTIGSHIILFCNYAIIANWVSLDGPTKIYLAVWSIFVQITWATTLQVSGMFHSYSIKTLKSWEAVKVRDTLGKKVFNKFRKSLKPLAIGLKGTMTFRELTALKFLRAIVTGTFRALLTLSRKI
ncbi:hypothetical protein Fcan01_25083 [Folsomia candida]|uniref:Gustatory receptor n=1 Tax=Folsomia candida TaxID=158441 RepID=A0A226D7I5_FOLCA|nr:hypothetical protein Fcan01_25083 [Folsomia candida]